MLQFLERRLDNIVCRLGFASSRRQARQFVRHGHIMVNGLRLNIPSYLVNKGDEISVHPHSRQNPVIAAALQEIAGQGVHSWLSLEGDNFKGQVLELPRREEINIPIEEQLIVELYSK